MRVLVLNCGSSSLKFQIVDIDPHGAAPARGQRRPRGTIERIGATATCSFTGADGTHHETVAIGDHHTATAHALAHVAADGSGFDAVGHRVVHGGARFTASTRIDEQVLADIEAVSDLAPLHNPACLNGIVAARAACEPAVPMVAVFDTAFHHTLPEYAARYAIPTELADRHHIKRYGFHGIAHSFVATRYGQISGTPTQQAKLITVHLGNGCSAAAIRHGRSVDTSMGFTPLEGLMMGTRSGDIDPAVVSYLSRREAVAASDVEDWLNHRSGLLGVSQRSNDMRELLAAMDTDHAARLAVDMFCYRVGKYIGAYLVVLGGADAVIFSGGIGEHCAFVRAQICERLQWCGLVLDEARNAASSGAEARISSGNGLHAYVIPADEELLIAQETARCVSAAR